MISNILLVFAFVFCIIAAFWRPATPPAPRVHFGWLGMAFWILSILLAPFFPK